MTINACFARMVAHTKDIYNIFLWIYQIKTSRPICRDALSKMCLFPLYPKRPGTFGTIGLSGISYVPL